MIFKNLSCATQINHMYLEAAFIQTGCYLNEIRAFEKDPWNFLNHKTMLDTSKNINK